MAKLTTTPAEITAAADGGAWSGTVTYGSAGAKTVYMRVNGSQVLTRNFTATVGGGISLDATYPKTGFRDTTGYTGASFNTDAIGDGSSGKLYVLVTVTNANSGNSFQSTLSGGTWTPIKRSNFTNGTGTDWGGVSVYYSTEALSSQVVSVTRQDSAASDPWGWGWAVYRFSGANTSTPVGNTASTGSNSPINLECAITPTYTGSYLIGAGLRGHSEVSLNNLNAGNTADYYGSLDAQLAYDTAFSLVHGTSLSTASTPITLGHSDNTWSYNSFVAVEVRAA